MAENKKILLPDVGEFKDIEVIEILVTAGEQVEAEQSIIVLESDKATMEIPSPFSGTIESITVSIGDRLNEGDPIGTVTAAAGTTDAKVEQAPAVEEVAAVAEVKKAETEIVEPEASIAEAPAPAKADASPGKPLRPHPGAAERQLVGGNSKMIHASPSIRRYARELGVNLEQIIATGTKGRIVKADVKAFVKSTMSSGGGGGGGIAVTSIPEVDHSKFGEIEKIALSRIKKISGAHLHRSWVNVPHVTQFDETDITELEAFRKSLAKEAEAKSLRLTPIIFLMKAVVNALQEYPDFNASLDVSGENLILKKYFHIGVAVDTPKGLMVPVVRDVDQKGLFDLAAELGDLAAKAREGKLSPTDMQGGCFTISSLGGIGGTQFTPIVNAPEVAILGVARSKMQPVYQDGEFVPRLMLPLALSYDHRVIDGAQGARFISYLSQVISDIRRVLL
jgi:pyruvate dehydrogenase E2 component (dihydrolipoamide acetyltransferase)